MVQETKLNGNPKGNAGPAAPSAGGNSKHKVGMLTTDVALIHDEYRDIVKIFAEDHHLEGLLPGHGSVSETL